MKKISRYWILSDVFIGNKKYVCGNILSTFYNKSYAAQWATWLLYVVNETTCLSGTNVHVLLQTIG